MISPAKLLPGDEIRVITPIRSLSIVWKEGIAHSTKRLEAVGFQVSFGNGLK